MEIGIEYSTKIVSYNKMLGQLQDAGNTTTLARYLKLTEQAGLLCGLNKYSSSMIITKGTIPKYQVHNNALYSARSTMFFGDSQSNPDYWGNVLESAIGAHLTAQVSKYTNASLFYWREKEFEVDYVVTLGQQILGIEVKGGNENISEMAGKRFLQRYPNAKLLLVGKHGIPYDVFLKTELPELF